MDFIRNALKINIRDEECMKKYPMPNYMISRYSIKKGNLGNQKVFFVYPKTELDQVNSIKKHIQKLQSYEKIPVVLVLSNITMKERQGLLDSEIPFIVENKQCYLPFMGTFLTERCDADQIEVEKMIPSAQMLLFYYIYTRQKELPSNTAVEALGVSAMTVTRAVRQLEQLGLIKTHKSGVMKILTTEFSWRELYEKSLPYLSSPIKRTIYIPKAVISNELLYAGDTALSMRTMLNPPRIDCFAGAVDSRWRKYEKSTLVDDKEQVILQVWKYDPRKLTGDDTVDILSLAASYKDDFDERIEEVVEDMIEDFWRKTDG